MLCFLEETVPVHRIWIDIAEKDEMPPAPFELSTDEEAQRVMESLYAAMTETRGLAPAEAIERIRNTGMFGGLVDQLVDAEDGQ